MHHVFFVYPTRAASAGREPSGGEERLRVKGFISLFHREFSGLNCGNSIIMSRRAWGGVWAFGVVRGQWHKRLSLILFGSNCACVEGHHFCGACVGVGAAARGRRASDGERSNAIFSFSWAQRLQSVDRHHKYKGLSLSLSAICVCVCLTLSLSLIERRREGAQEKNKLRHEGSQKKRKHQNSQDTLPLSQLKHS